MSDLPPVLPVTPLPPTPTIKTDLSGEYRSGHESRHVRVTVKSVTMPRASNYFLTLEVVLQVRIKLQEGNDFLLQKIAFSYFLQMNHSSSSVTTASSDAHPGDNVAPGGDPAQTAHTAGDQTGDLKPVVSSQASVSTTPVTASPVSPPRDMLDEERKKSSIGWARSEVCCRGVSFSRSSSLIP